MRKKKPLPLLQDIEITGVAAEGNALAHMPDGRVLFVPYGAPGDVADIQLDRKRHSFAQGHIVTLKSPSPHRVAPRCSHFGVCGGCRWQHIPYAMQLELKRTQVADALERIAKVPLPGVLPVIGSESQWEYRNKMEYTFAAKGWLSREEMEQGKPFEAAAGFHIPGAFDKVLDITRCHLQHPLGDRLRLHVKDAARRLGLSHYDLRAGTGLVRTLMIRITPGSPQPDVMAVVMFGCDDPEAIRALMDDIAAAFPEITSLMYAVNTKANDSWTDLPVSLWRGQPYITERMEDLEFRVGPKSFYQTNSRQALALYRVAREAAALQGDELVYDLYTGTGTIANFVARHCRRVVGIEYVPEAIDDARLNSSLNAIGNTEFLAGDMKDVLTDAFIAATGRPDVVIVDPPRAGMHPSVVEVLLRAAPRRIVYVSCNPATQARDIALLHPAYAVERVQPVDMFPHTHHVECVATLVRRDPAGEA